MLSRLFIAAIVVVLSSGAVFSAEVSELATGKIPDADLKKMAPESDFITDAKTFARLWKAWRPGETVPEIDFNKELVIVGTVDGPNLIILSPKLHDDGDLKFILGSTRMFGPGFGYRMVKVAREGVKSVNGKSIDAGIVQGTITIPESLKIEQGQKVEVKLFEHDPLLADAPAKLIDEKIIKEIEHEEGKATEVPFDIGSNFEVQKDRHYYITVFVLEGEERTHIGEIEGKRGLNVVLKNGERSPINVILRQLK